ncbi:MAG: hypothetical protein EOM40_16360 [Clostridia bacterium]|nr:hypothetical protein [Clostridia bacterium]
MQKNADFVRCCDFLARMIEKYGALVLRDYYAGMGIKIDKWKSDKRTCEDRIFSYAEKLGEYQEKA